MIFFSISTVAFPPTLQEEQGATGMQVDQQHANGSTPAHAHSTHNSCSALQLKH